MKSLSCVTLCPLALLLLGCPTSDNTAARQLQNRPTTQEAAPTPRQDAPTRAPLVARRREIMSTWFELKVAGADDAERAGAVLERALDEIARVEAIVSEWQPHTDVSRVNEAAGGDPVVVGPETLRLLRIGQEVSGWSEGAFDLTWAALRGLYRFDPNEPPAVPTQREIDARRNLVDYRGVAINVDKRTIRLAKPGMAIGVGGIAKGYALDRVGEMLKSEGYPNYLLFAGGQVQVHGSRGARPWRIGIKHPRDEQNHIGFFELYEGSVSTSGDYEHYFLVGSDRYHHIIDPATGRPANRSVAVTLITSQGAYADALSTACFVLGPARCLAFLARVKGHPQALIIDPELRIHMTPGLKDKVVFNPPLEDGRLPPRTEVAR